MDPHPRTISALLGTRPNAYGCDQLLESENMSRGRGSEAVAIMYEESEGI